MNRPATPVAARPVADAYADISCELSYIQQLAELVGTQADRDDPNTVEALAWSINAMAQSVMDKLEQHQDDETSRNGVDHG